MTPTPEIPGTIEMTATTYLLLPQLAQQLGLPQTYLKKLTDSGQIPYLDSGRHRHYNADDVTVALSRIAHANLPQAPSETPLDFTEFTTRAAKVLKLLKVITWEQLAALPKEQLLAAPNIGTRTMEEIGRKLAAQQAQRHLWSETEEEAQPRETAVAPAVYDGDQR